jgi:hypothetical protein
MFIPLASPEKYNLIMNSTETFHYGRGYWWAKLPLFEW